MKLGSEIAVSAQGAGAAADDEDATGIKERRGKTAADAGDETDSTEGGKGKERKDEGQMEGRGTFVGLSEREVEDDRSDTDGNSDAQDLTTRAEGGNWRKGGRAA